METEITVVTAWVWCFVGFMFGAFTMFVVNMRAT